MIESDSNRSNNKEHGYTQESIFYCTQQGSGSAYLKTFELRLERCLVGNEGIPGRSNRLCKS